MIVALLLSMLVITQQGFNLTLESKCNKNSPIIAKFTVANYGPPLTEMKLQMNRAYFIDMCAQVTNSSIIALLKDKSTRKAVLSARGNCTFVTMTLNAQALGADLLMVYPNMSYPVLPVMQGNSTIPINISSVLISYQTVLSISLNMYASYCEPMEINIFQVEEPIRIQLPSVFFDINDPREMEYLSEFYRHQFFDSFIAKMKIQHRIVYTSKDCSKKGCDLDKDCLLSTPIESNNYLCYTVKDYQHSGKRIMKEQFRSLAIFQILGQAKWFQYRELFYHNLCHFNQLIENCINKTLLELEVDLKMISQITARMEDYQRPEKVINIKDHLVMASKVHESTYTSQMPLIYSQLCKKITEAPEECKIFSGTPKKISISSNEAIIQDIQMVSQRIFFIQISKSVMDKLDELILILTDQPHAFISFENIDSNPNLEKSLSDFEIKGRFGFSSNITKNNIHFSSKSDLQNQKYIILKSKEIVSSNLTVMLSLVQTNHYKLMIRAKFHKEILRSNQELFTIWEDKSSINTVVELVFDEGERNFEFVIIFKAKKISSYPGYLHLYAFANGTLGSINLLRYYDSNGQYELNTKLLSENLAYIHISKRKALEIPNNYKNCKIVRSERMTNIYTCKFVLSYSRYYEKVQMIHVALQKFNNSEEIRPLNSALQTRFVRNVPTVQKITLNARDLPFKLYQFGMEVQTNQTILKHQYRILKQGFADFTSLSEWKQGYKQRTDPLYHEDRYDSNHTYVSVMQMRHPYNSLKQHLKIKNITIFLIYTPINDNFVENQLINQSIRLTSDKIEERWLGANSYQQYSVGLQFLLNCKYEETPLSKQISSVSNTMLQVHQKDENIRIFARKRLEVVLCYQKQYQIIRQIRFPKIYQFFKSAYDDQFTHFASSSNNQLKHKHPDFLQHVERPFAQMIRLSPNVSAQRKLYSQNSQLRLYSSEYRTYIQVFVEMIHKNTVLEKAPLYLIGNTFQKAEKDETKIIRTGSFTTVNLLTGQGGLFLIESTMSIRILNLEALFDQYTYMLQVCTYKKGSFEQINLLLLECFNYTKNSVKNWKNLKNGQIVKGVKLDEQVMQIKINIPTVNQIPQFLYKQKKSLDIFVKIKIREFEKMIEADEQILRANKTESQIIMFDNSQEILKSQMKQQDQPFINNNDQKEQNTTDKYVETKDEKDMIQSEKQKKENETKAQKESERQEKEKEAIAQKEKEAREREAKEKEAKEREKQEKEKEAVAQKEKEAREREAKEKEAKVRERQEKEKKAVAQKEKEAREREAKEKEAKERERQEKEKKAVAQKEKEAKEREQSMNYLINKTHQIISEQLSKHLQQEKKSKSISQAKPDLIASSPRSQQLVPSLSQTSTVLIIIIIILVLIVLVLLFNTFVLHKLQQALKKQQPERRSNSLSEEQSAHKISKNQSIVMS